MEKWKKFLKDFSLKSDIINTIIGITLIVSLIIIFRNPGNQYAVLFACTAGGLMNVMNGMNMVKDPKKKAMGMSFILMGLILAALGFVLMDQMKKV